MNVSSLGYIFFAGGVAVAYNLAVRVQLRQLLVSLASLVFLASLVPNVASWLCLAAFIGYTYLGVRVVGESQRSGWFVLVLIASTVAAFVFLKRYAFLTWLLPPSVLDHSLQVVGLSYMLFKFIHVLVDKWQGQLAPLSFWSYVNYQLAFFTILAGPIQRYNDFHKDWELAGSEPADVGDALLAWGRLLTGIVKMGMIAPIIGYYFDLAGTPPVARLIGRLCVNFYAFPLYLYFNFSGYTDISIGTARLLGIRLPENFNYPFAARNVLDFWNRWHITLTQWIRDYIFMTSYKASAERWPMLSRYLGYGLIGFALFIAGVWHGVTGGFAIFGLLHGLAAAMNQAYSDALRTLLGRALFQRYQRNKVIHFAAIVLTFHFLCFTTLFFSGRFDLALELLRTLHVRGSWLVEAMSLLHDVRLVAALAVLLSGVAVWHWYKDGLRAVWLNVCEQVKQRTSALYGFVGAEAVLVGLGLLVMWAWENKDPVVIYMRF